MKRVYRDMPLFQDADWCGLCCVVCVLCVCVVCVCVCVSLCTADNTEYKAQLDGVLSCEPHFPINHRSCHGNREAYLLVRWLDWTDTHLPLTLLQLGLAPNEGIRRFLFSAATVQVCVQSMCHVCVHVYVRVYVCMCSTGYI